MEKPPIILTIEWGHKMRVYTHLEKLSRVERHAITNASEAELEMWWKKYGDGLPDELRKLIQNFEEPLGAENLDPKLGNLPFLLRAVIVHSRMCSVIT